MQEKINKTINDIKNITIASDEDALNFQKIYLSKKGILKWLHKIRWNYRVKNDMIFLILAQVLVSINVHQSSI